MLCQFSVKNYKSIKEEITLDMQATSISEHEDRLIVDIDKENYLPISVLYGPNGAGKSNVLDALTKLVLIVARPILAVKIGSGAVISNNRIIVEPFAFSNTKNEPTEFELFYRTEKIEYRYVLHIKQDTVVYERLDRVRLDSKKQRAELFERSANGISLKGDFQKLKVSNDLSATLPLLSYLGIAFIENDTVRDAVDGICSGFILLNYGEPYSELGMGTSLNGINKDLILQLLKEMDLDIVDFRIEKKDNDINILTKHCVDDKYTELPLDHESSGTRKIFYMLPLLVKGMLEGRTFIVDELDAKLHPLLLKHIIMMINDMSVNRNKAQLVFTSHDLSTMNSEVFRRDEIWFVAKGSEQNSQLYSLVEFKTEKGKSVRKDAKFDKQYLEGRYGADPYLRRIIDWSAQNA